MKTELADMGKWSREAHARNEVVYRYGMGVLSAPLPISAKLTRGDREHEGKTYMYRSVWSSDETADKWFATFPAGVIVASARSFFDNHLIVWFSVNR